MPDAMLCLRYLCLLILLAVVPLQADVPGNKPRPDGSLTVVNASAFPELSIYLEAEGNQQRTLLTDSLLLVLPGGYGAPVQFILYAVRNRDSLVSKPLPFAAFNGQVKLRIDSLCSADSTLVVSPVTQVAAGQEQQQAAVAPETDTNRTWLWVSLSAAAVAVVVFVVLWLRRRKTVVVAPVVAAAPGQPSEAPATPPPPGPGDTKGD